MPNRSKNNFLSVKNITADSADIYFLGEIVNDDWGKWTDTDKCPEDVLTELNKIQGVKNLNIYINSPGGSVFAGIAIYNILKRFDAYKTVYIDGLAASIASVIAMVGDEIIIPSNAFLMIHKPLAYMGYADANDLRKAADMLDTAEQGILNTYATKIKDNVEIDFIKKLVDEETWLTGDEASNYFNVTVTPLINLIAKVNYPINLNNIPKELVNEVKEDNQEEVLEKLQSEKINRLKLELETI